MPTPVKLSSPTTHEFWEIPVLFEDAHLLALDKPAGLQVSPNRDDSAQPSLIQLLHAGIAAGKPWASGRNLSYLMHAHRLDSEITGVILFAKAKPVLVALANLSSNGKVTRHYAALAHGEPKQARFEIEARLSAHPTRPGMMRVDPRDGKRSRTVVEVIERFSREVLLGCETSIERPHQVRVHLSHAGLRVVGDELYGGKPLWLSRLKPDYRLKEGKTERPLISRPALHAERITLTHPVTGEVLTIVAPWPKDLNVAVKCLRQYSIGRKAV